MSNILVTTNQNVIDVTNVSGITVTTPEGQTIAVTVPNSSVNVTTTTDDITVVTNGQLTYNITAENTDQIPEGTTNLYFTTQRARDSISVTGSGSYNSATGEITVTGGVTSVNTKTGAVTLTTTDINEGTNLYYTNTRFDTRLAAKTTDNLNEGTTNLYFTNTRARQAISATDTGGDGSLSYDNSTGIITYTGPSASEVRSHFTAGTGVTISSGQIAIGQPVATTDSVTFNNVAVTTNLRLNGNKIYNSTNDEFIRLVKDVNGTKFIEFGEPGGYDVSLYPGAVVYKGDVAQTTSSTTLTTTAPNQIIDQYDKLSQRASNYVVQIRSGTEYEIWEGMLLHDGTNVITNSYGELRTGSASLATITADISGNYVRLLATPTNANTTFRLFKTIFEE